MKIFELSSSWWSAVSKSDEYTLPVFKAARNTVPLSSSACSSTTSRREVVHTTTSSGRRRRSASIEESFFGVFSVVVFVVFAFVVFAILLLLLLLLLLLCCRLAAFFVLAVHSIVAWRPSWKHDNFFNTLSPLKPVPGHSHLALSRGTHKLDFEIVKYPGYLVNSWKNHAELKKKNLWNLLLNWWLLAKY